MICKDIQEYLLTDYPDRQLNAESTAEIEMHLRSCVQCLQYSEAICKSLVEPFSGATKISLTHERVWNNIKQRIKEEQPEASLSNPFVEMIRRARQSVSLNRPAFALLAVSVIALIAMAYFNTKNPEVAVLSQPSESGAKSISYVADELSDHQSDDQADYGTDIEKYFL
ncbi:MAG: zf-HC2 domain-containing protein [Nitrospirae bacterium]|nr:zf-HC2 domain-containing protein [Nitrospirota bacterium]